MMVESWELTKDEKVEASEQSGQKCEECGGTGNYLPMSYKFGACTACKGTGTTGKRKEIRDA